MKRTLTLVAIMCAIALSGCGSPSAETQAPLAPSPTAAPATSATIAISEEATCTLLVGPNEDGPLIRYVNGISSTDVTDPTAVPKLRDHKDEVVAIGDRSNPELQLLITTLMSDDVNDFKAAGVELLTRCG